MCKVCKRPLSDHCERGDDTTHATYCPLVHSHQFIREEPFVFDPTCALCENIAVEGPHEH